LTCPLDNGELAGASRSSTTWTLSGTVIGDSTQRQTRLLVLDLPLP
jgi:hypothetical protein